MRTLLLLLLTVVTVFADDDAFVIDMDEEYIITVRERAVAPLSPSSRVIKSSEFQGKFFSDLPSVLETISGIDIRAAGGYGQYAESAIRGGAALGTRVYLDGVLLNSASSGAVDLSKIPLDRIREIRVTKSASGLRLMGAGMGGVIELFSADGANKAADKKIVAVNFEAGSFGYVKGGLMVRSSPQAPSSPSSQSSQSSTKIIHQFNIDMSKSDNNYPFIHDNGTTIPTRRDPDPAWDDTLLYKRNNYYRSIDAAYSFCVNINKNHRLTQRVSAGAFQQGLFVYHYKNDQSGSTSGNAVTYGIDYHGQLTPRLTIGGEGSGVYRGGTISDPDGKISLGGGKELASRGGVGDLLVDARYALTDEFYLAGLTAARAEHHSQRNMALDDRPEMTRYEYRAGAEAGFRSPSVNNSGTEAALRVLYKREIDSSTAGLGYWSSNGSRHTLGYPIIEAAVRREFRPVTLQLTAVSSKRSPTFFERFGWGGGFISNPSLKEETRMEADAGVSLDMGEWSAAASLFAGRVRDKIKSIPQGSFVRVMNFADTEFYGAEFDIVAKLRRMFTVELSTAYLRSTVIAANDPGWVGKVEPFVPAFSGFLKTEIDIREFTAGHGARYESECYLSIENLKKKETQYELSAWASYTIKDILTLRYRVTNYTNTANFDFLNNPKPRRTHVVSISLSP